MMRYCAAGYADTLSITLPLRDYYAPYAALYTPRRGVDIYFLRHADVTPAACARDAFCRAQHTLLRYDAALFRYFALRDAPCCLFAFALILRYDYAAAIFRRDAAPLISDITRCCCHDDDAALMMLYCRRRKLR